MAPAFPGRSFHPPPERDPKRQQSQAPHDGGIPSIDCSFPSSPASSLTFIRTDIRYKKSMRDSLSVVR